jgi:NTE family protein
MKRALVLSGGGSRGAFEVGALEYLVREAGLDFKLFLGTSVGALNAAFLGQARNHSELLQLTQDLKELWLSLKGNHSIYQRSLLGYFRLLFWDALYTPSGLYHIIKEHITLSRLCDPAAVVKVSAVAQETGELFYADSRRPELRPYLLDYILASASMPLFFPGVAINGKHWYDGGLRDITPLGAVFEENPDEILVIITYPIKSNLKPALPEQTHGGALNALLRTIDILTSEISANDLELAANINQCHWVFPGRRQVPIRVVAPEAPLPGEGPLDFNPACIRDSMERGYRAAQKPRFLGFNKIARVNKIN